MNLNDAWAQHDRHPNAVATVTAVQPFGRFGAVDIDNTGLVSVFVEKPKGDVGWINRGFFVLDPSIVDFIQSDVPFGEESR